MESLFFIAILPPLAISDAIEEIRKQCSLEHQVYSALKPPVHITLAPTFIIDSKLESKLISSLEHCQNFQPFDQELRDYNGFPPKVVFINANKNPGITALRKTITDHLKPYLKKKPGTFNPHVTIAYRDVEESVYYQIMKTYSKKRFRINFNVNKFALLKHDGKKWNIFREFESRPHNEQFKMVLQ